MPTKPKNPLPRIDKNIGKNLAEIRKKKGISQVELADKTGISQQLLSHYEIGRLHIAAEMVIRLAQILDVSTDKILNLKDEYTSQSNLNLRFTRRMRELDSLPEPKIKIILQVLDDFIRANK
jgi:transcriptional regulator with XRE-family HTH domain